MNLTKKEQKTLMSKIQPHIADILRELKKTTYTYREMAELCGMNPNRISQIIHNDRLHPLNRKSVRALIVSGNFFTVDGLLDRLSGSISETETKFIKKIERLHK